MQAGRRAQSGNNLHLRTDNAIGIRLWERWSKIAFFEQLDQRPELRCRSPGVERGAMVPPAFPFLFFEKLRARSFGLNELMIIIPRGIFVGFFVNGRSPLAKIDCPLAVIIPLGGRAFGRLDDHGSGRSALLWDKVV